MAAVVSIKFIDLLQHQYKSRPNWWTSYAAVAMQYTFRSLIKLYLFLVS